MGIYSRDYLRETSGRHSGGGGDGAGWKWIIGLTVGVFVLQLLSMRPAEFPAPPQSLVENWLELNPVSVLHGQVWRLVTYAFCHDVGSVWHILFNMLWLWFLGRNLEQMYGTLEFVLFYLAGAVVSGLAFLGLGLFLRDLSPAIGASGAVLAVTMLYAMHFPRQVVYILGLIPIEIRWIVGLILVFDLYPVLRDLGGAGVSDGVAHSAHLGGLAFGFIYFRRKWNLESIWNRLRGGNLRRAFAPRPKIRVFEPSLEEESQSLETQVDAILEKIHNQGESSLTEKERDILKAASRRYKNR